MLESKQELKCCCQDWDKKAEVKAGVENIQFVSPRIRFLEGKMNDERMISHTPMVHKLDEVSSWCLADCSKYMKESQRKKVNVVSHVGWFFLLLGSEERERQDRSVLLERPA